MDPWTREFHRSFADDELELILLPTEACNLRCVYCYEDFHLGRMRDHVVRGVRALIGHRAPGLRSLKLSWFGGEPLLALDVVEEVMCFALEVRNRHSRMRVRSTMSTNAYGLTPGVFERLLELEVRQFQITLDGPREWHDRKRVRCSGAGTFDRIWANLEAMRDAKQRFEVLVRVHVDAENRSALEPFLLEYQRAFGGDSRFELFFRRTERLGGPNDAALPVMDDADGEAAVEQLNEAASRLGLGHFSEGDMSICYAARGNSLLVRADGRIGKCTVALDHPNNQVGHIGEDGALQLDVERLKSWMRGFWSADFDELACPMRGYADKPTGERLGNVRLRTA